ncbi:MAG: heme biosynthesis protein HemY [Ahrensia sp.]|nr:heme biosynthesis protein HemY [Ahrensia sp.]
MLRVLLFIVAVAILGLGFAFLADTPGTLVMTVAGREITVSLMVAAVALVAAVGAVMLTWWIFKIVFTSPQRMQRFFRARRRDRGYQSLSTGIIAAGAGDSVTARKMLKQAGGLLNSTTEPMIQLLDAQASIVEGHHAEAREKFEAMLEDPELRIFGLRGLYMEAKRLGDRDAAKHYAEKAAELAPQLRWAGTAALELKTASGDWDGAIRLLESQKKAKQLEPEEIKRKRAVLLTALAQENIEKDPAKAKSAAMEAHRLAPEFAPAAIAAAQALIRLNELRRGAHVLESTWRKAPHPEIALAYVNARPGDSSLDRYKRAQRLEKLKPNNTDSSMIVAQMATEAGEFSDARKAIAAVLRNEPREGAFMLMADIEDAETGDQGKVREWLARAVRAPRDPAWTADGYVAEEWAPVSPISGRLDAFEWKVPVERLGPVVENDLDPMVRGISAPAMAEPEPAEEARIVEAAEPEPEMVDEASTVIEGEVVEPAAEEAAPEATPVAEQEEIKQPEEAPAEADSEPAEKPEAEETKAGDAAETAEPVEAAPAEPEKPAEPVANSEPKQDEDTRPPIPDDPGIDPDAEPEEHSRRFRLF